MADPDAALAERAEPVKERPAGACSGTTRLRHGLAEACGPCPERGGALRREMLCRCPVALTLRLLERVEHVGADPASLTAAERASLAFQERALARRLPLLDVAAVLRATTVVEELRGLHAGCLIEGCLACRACEAVERLALRLGEPSTA